jgi:hypothetical protein
MKCHVLNFLPSLISPLPACSVVWLIFCSTDYIVTVFDTVDHMSYAHKSIYWVIQAKCPWLNSQWTGSLFATTSRPGEGPIQSPLQCILEDPFPGHEVDHSTTTWCQGLECLELHLHGIACRDIFTFLQSFIQGTQECINIPLMYTGLGIYVHIM